MTHEHHRMDQQEADLPKTYGTNFTDVNPYK